VAPGPTLVTGATGFLGRHLVGALLRRGTRVRVVARDPTRAAALGAVGAEVVAGDVLDAAALRAASAGCAVVYHLAGVVSHRRRDRPLLHAANVEGVRGVLAALEPGARLVHVSSVAAVGPAPGPERPADESNQFPGVARALPYAATKRAGEELVLAAARGGVDAVVANPGFLLGPGDVYRVSTWHVESYLAGRLRFTAPGGISNVDARDVAEGLVAVAEAGRSGERYILTSREGNLDHRSFFHRVGDVAGIRRRMLHVPRHLALAAARLPLTPVHRDEVEAACNWWFHDPGKAERELGFTTRPLDETLADTVAAYRPASAHRHL
jgi:dihydroflavonol-4-reductase